MCCPEEIQLDPNVEFDPRFMEFMKPWDGEEEPAVLSGMWHFWPNTDYFAEIVSVLQAYVRRLQDEREDLVIIETGVGQGYLTRRLAPLMRPERDLYWAYEPHHAHRQEIAIRDFWLKNLTACIKEHPTPEHHEMAAADLIIVNTPPPWCMAEYFLWQAVKQPHSMMLTTAPVGQSDSVGPGIVGVGETATFREMWTSLVEQVGVTV